MDKKDKKIKIFYDTFGNTLNVWFDDPEKEHIAEETGEEVVLVKDKKGQVIGFEKLNFMPMTKGTELKSLPVELVMT